MNKMQNSINIKITQTSRLSGVPTPEVLKRYEAKKKQLIIISIALFFITLLCYSPNAVTSFLPRTSFASLVFLGAFLGGFFFYVGTIFYIIFFTPPGSIPFPTLRKYFKPNLSPYTHETSKKDDPRFEPRDDWYNDSTNPISPLYKEIHRHHE